MTDTPSVPVPAPPGRGLYCNRTLNLRAIRAIGFDMDYTLVHFDVDAWEERAYVYLQQKLHEHGWPVDGLSFIPQFATRGSSSTRPSATSSRPTASGTSSA